MFIEVDSRKHAGSWCLSRQQRAATLSTFETLSFLSEGAIFVYVGLDALDPIKWKARALFDIPACITALLGCYRCQCYHCP